MFPDKLHKLIAAILCVSMLVVYLMTVAPTISFWDCGEFVTCSYIMGIPHPPGSPLLSLIGRVMTLIPFHDFRGYGVGEIAYRVNMIDVILGALTVMLTYLIMVQLLHKVRPYTGRRLDELIIMVASLITAFMAGFSDEFWTNAIEIETYMPSLFMQMLALWLTLRWSERRDNPRSVMLLFLAAYIVGLGNGVHLTVLIIAPVLFLLVVFSKPEWFSELQLWISTMAFIAFMGVLKLFGGYALFYGLMAVFAFVMPFLLYHMYRKNHEVWKIVFMGIVFCTSLFIIGFSVYPTVMVRAAKNPAINEGNPDTWERYKLYLERDQYGQENMYTGMFTRKASAEYQFSFMYFRYLLKQFPKWGPSVPLVFENDRSPDQRFTEGMAVRDTAYLSVLLLILVLYGLYTHAATDWRRFTPLMLFFFASSVGLVLYLNMANPQVRERPYFFLGSFYIVMYWVGFGIFGILTDITGWLTKTGRENMAAPTVGVLMALFLTLIPTSVLSNHIDPAYTQYETHDRTGDFAPKDYGYNILASCEQDAILFTNGDNDTFPLWYLQEAEGFRKDVRVVNLSLLNTSWYILQMKHEGETVPTREEFEQILADGSRSYLIDRAAMDSLGVRTTNTAKTVPIEYDDDYIENVLCSREEEHMRQRLYQGDGREVTAAGISWFMPAQPLPGNPGYGMFRIQDVMVYNIVRWVNWERPIYFAVTVARENMSGLDQYLSMEGMVYRLVEEEAPIGGDHVNTARLDNNIFNVYQYHQLADPEVYKPPNTVKLTTNYYVGFAQLAQSYLAAGDTENAARAAWGGINNTPNTREQRFLLYRLLNAGGYDAIDEFIEWEYDKLEDRSYEARAEFGLQLAEQSLYEQAFDHYTALVADFPGNPEPLEIGLALAHALGRYEDALDLADRLIELDPESDEAVQRRDAIRALLDQEQDAPPDSTP